MSGTLSLVYGAFVVLVGLYAFHLYRRRELRVPGVTPLALLRVGALAVVLLLLLDPSVPAAVAGGGARSWLLVDGSRSMAAPPGEGGPWSVALERARNAGGPDGVLLFGARPRPLSAVDVGAGPPFDSSRLVPALERAAESGARAVRIVSDLRLEDAAEARATARRLGLEVAVEATGQEVRSAGVAELGVEGPLEAERPVAAEVAVFAAGAGGDSATVEVREEGRLLASRPVTLPDDGRIVRLSLDLPPPAGEGVVRYSARVVLAGDGFPDDDERVVYADVDPETGNLVLVSLEPDWEPRFLLPVLQRVTGLPARGYLRVGEDRYLVMDPAGAGGTVDRAAVASMADGAELLVVQAEAGLPPWLSGALAAVRRGVVLAAGPEAARAVGVQAGAAAPGEWYASPDVPPSPLAGEIGGAALAGLPPLSDLLPLLTAETPGPVPLSVQLRGAGEAEPALVLLSPEGGGRRVLALASGFWRWAFREGTGRDAYERLWSGVAGWLLADEPLARGPGVRPEERVVPRGAPVTWSAEGLAGERVALRMSRGDTVVLDTALTVPEAGRFRTPGADPGTYAWEAEPVRGEGATEGRLDVEAWTPDLMYPRDTVLASPGDGASSRTRHRAPGRPLRTHPLPYILVLVLLSAEWIGRRRKGLR